jgi:competence protein ComEC
MRKKTKQILGRVGGIMLLAVLSIFINQFMSYSEKEATRDVANPTDIMEVHFIDVGQGDAILVEAGNSTMLIDAGENNKGTIVKEYLNNQQITKLDYIIGTHPHSDHIGGLDTILDSFEVGKVLLPHAVHTTATFEEVLDALERHNLSITAPEVGAKYYLGSASFTILAPSMETYDEINNYSIAIKLTFGDTNFVLAGDAENKSELEMLETGINLTADVLKLSHHGSSYSSSNEFLEAVNPTYSIVCVGKDNEYGHPHAKTLQALLDRDIKLYRTDEQGTVVFTSNGQTISVNTEDYIITEQDLEQ